MTERGQRKRKNNKIVAYTAAILVHAVIIGAVFVNFTRDTETVEAAYADKVDVVRATTIEESQIQQQENLLKEQEREKERQRELEQQQLKELQAKAEQEKRNIEDLKKLQEQEKLKAAELEKEREALALKRKEEEEEREKELAAEAERQKKLAEEKKREEQLAQEKRELEETERQRLLQESLAAEEAFLAEQISKERTTTLVQKHLALIGQQIKEVRTLTPGIESWRETLVNIKVSSSGDVTSVRTLESSGSAAYDRSVETSIYKASPLAIPDSSIDANLHRQFLDFDFLVKASD